MIDFVSIKVWYWIAGGALVAGAAAGYGLCHLQATATIATQERNHTQALADIRKEKETETAKVRATEKKLNDAAHKTKEFHEGQLAEREVIIAGLRTAESYQRATAVELRRDLARYLARKPAADPACPSDPRTATLGTLLQDVIDVAEQNDATAREIAEGAERHAAEVRVLRQYALTVCRGQ